MALVASRVRTMRKFFAAVETRLQGKPFCLGPVPGGLVRTEIIKPIFLRQTIHPMLLRHLVPRQPLAEARLHRLQLGHGRAARRRIAGAMLEDKLLDEVMPVDIGQSAWPS